MTKAIVSSKSLQGSLSKITFSEEYEVIFNKSASTLNVGSIEINCECSAHAVRRVSYKSINALIHFLTLIDEQPITIGVDNKGWLYIKEAIL